MRLDHQEHFDRCEHCHNAFEVTRGSVFEDNEGIAIYLAAMHGCESRSVDLAIGIRQGYNGATETSAIFIKAHPTSDEIRMTVVDPKESFWQTEAYLGRHLSREEALANPLLESFFHIADHIVTEIPGLRNYLEKQTAQTPRTSSLRNSAGSALTRYDYTGRERDPDPGLMYYRARWYDPQAGRFISEDPTAFAGRGRWERYRAWGRAFS